MTKEQPAPMAGGDATPAPATNTAQEHATPPSNQTPATNAAQEHATPNASETPAPATEGEGAATAGNTHAPHIIDNRSPLDADGYREAADGYRVRRNPQELDLSHGVPEPATGRPLGLTEVPGAARRLNEAGAQLEAELRHARQEAGYEETRLALMAPEAEILEAERQRKETLEAFRNAERILTDGTHVLAAADENGTRPKPSQRFANAATRTYDPTPWSKHTPTKKPTPTEAREAREAEQAKIAQADTLERQAALDMFNRRTPDPQAARQNENRADAETLAAIRRLFGRE